MQHHQYTEKSAENIFFICHLSISVIHFSAVLNKTILPFRSITNIYHKEETSEYSAFFFSMVCSKAVFAGGCLGVPFRYGFPSCPKVSRRLTVSQELKSKTKCNRKSDKANNVRIWLATAQNVPAGFFRCTWIGGRRIWRHRECPNQSPPGTPRHSSRKIYKSNQILLHLSGKVQDASRIVCNHWYAPITETSNIAPTIFLIRIAISSCFIYHFRLSWMV